MPTLVEASVSAPLDAVRGALTDAEEIRRWFGWDYDGLEEEIRYIFFEHPGPRPTIRPAPDGSRTIVALDSPDELAEGWRAFFCQLGYYLEHHRGEERRTIHLSGEAKPRDVVELLEGESRRVSPFVTVADGAEGLAVLESSSQLDSDDPANVKLTVSTYGRDRDEVERMSERWQERWRSVALG